jgi:hypothetical protein
MTELRQVAVPPPSVADGAELLWIDRRMENYAVIVRPRLSWCLPRRWCST